MAGLMDSTALTPASVGGGMPAGAQPADPMAEGGEAVTPEEQELYDRFVGRAMGAIWKNPTRDSLISLMESAPSPQEGLSTAAATLIERIMGAAEQAGQKLPGDVMFAAGAEVFEQLAELAKESDVHDFDADQDALEGAYFLTLDKLRLSMSEQGKLDPEAMKTDLGMLQQADQSGMLEQELMALSSGGQGNEVGEVEMEDGADDEEMRRRA